MLALRHLTFSDRYNSEKLDVPGISQLPRGLFPIMHVVLDSVLATSNSYLWSGLIFRNGKA